MHVPTNFFTNFFLYSYILGWIMEHIICSGFCWKATIAVPLPAMAPQDQCQVWLISRSWVMTVLGLLLVFLECCYCALPYVFWMPGCLVNIAVIVDETIFRKCDLWLKQSLCFTRYGFVQNNPQANLNFWVFIVALILYYLNYLLVLFY